MVEKLTLIFQECASVVGSECTCLLYNEVDARFELMTDELNVHYLTRNEQ